MGARRAGILRKQIIDSRIADYGSVKLPDKGGVYLKQPSWQAWILIDLSLQSSPTILREILHCSAISKH